MRYLAFEAEERPISAQLFGSDPTVMAEAARICEEMGFDIVDINFGCPVNKVVKCNGGSGLLRDLPLVETILTTVRAAIQIPFTCKFRAGWNDNELVFVQMAKLAENCGLQAVALHPRTREQGYSGKADWSRIAGAKAAVKIPVIGNGDVLTPEDAVRMVRADEMRRGDDRPRRLFKPLDLRANSGIPGNWDIPHSLRPGALRSHAPLLQPSCGKGRA